MDFFEPSLPQCWEGKKQANIGRKCLEPLNAENFKKEKKILLDFKSPHFFQTTLNPKC